MLPSILRSFKLSPPFSFIDHITVGLRIFHLFHACQTTRPAFFFLCLMKSKKYGRRCQRCLRRESAPAHLLGLWVRILPGARMSVERVMCCYVEVSASDWSFAKRSPTECGESECDRRTSYRRTPPTRAVEPGKRGEGGEQYGLPRREIFSRFLVRPPS